MKFSATTLLLDRLRAPVESYRLVDFIGNANRLRVCDVGCGNGFIALSLACRNPDCTGIVGIDLTQQRIDEANEALLQLRKIADQRTAPVQFICADVCVYAPDNPFDALICNPPFFKSGSGWIPSDPAKRAARLDDHLSPDKLLASARSLLKHGGSLYTVYPAERLDEVKHAVIKNNFTIHQNIPEPEIRKRSGGVHFLKIQSS